MTYSRIHGLTLILLLLNFACGKTTAKQVTTSLPANGPSLPLLTGSNVLQMTVNGTTCAAGSYVNKPCVSVKVCAPSNASNCTTINDILVDTGSYGLRVFKSALGSTLSSALSPIQVSGQSLATCVQFGDGSKDWGPVESASVILGDEPAVTVPIQVIDSTFATSSTYCNRAMTSPSSAGFNGILGVGVFTQDCGTACTTNANKGIYFGCTGSVCNGITVSLANQVQNPVALLPVDNNGVVLELPSIPIGGATNASGYLVLGIGTQTNNTPQNVVSYPVDPSYGEFTTSLSGQIYNSFLDSGSNALYFPSSLKDCGSLNSGYSGWYCPSSLTSLTATNIGYSSPRSGIVNFQIGNLMDLVTGGGSVYLEIGGNVAIGGSVVFDWGLPFYLGRNVYTGIEHKTSSLGTGPYWAY